MIYIDTSAAVKLVRHEANSDDLSDWLAERRGRLLVSSAIIEVELLRATRRSAPRQLPRAMEVLGGITTVALSPAIRQRAARYPDPALRSVDAIHLATAEEVAAATAMSFEAFLAYDVRLLAVAEAAGLPVVAQGGDARALDG